MILMARNYGKKSYARKPILTNGGDGTASGVFSFGNGKQKKRIAIVVFAL